ncbi:MAG: peptidoglycan-binding domain-containing protein [Actinomycetota bacterium]|nr:peptidoglycan-binding domain-containing protein [Actinomycetota bacterium]
MGAVWHPNAVRRTHIDAGGFQGGGRKLVWHTTEGSSRPNYGGSAPHFTLNPANGSLWQHIPLNRGARALKAGGPNFWNTVQVELIGFARESHTWSEGRYKEIAELARWIEANFGVPRSVGVTFKGDGATPHMASLDEFKRYAGHVGHQHIPGNDHWDPGKLKIELILGDAGPAGGGAIRDLARGDHGEDVKVLQGILVKRGYKVLEPHINGMFGPTTEAFVVHFQWRHGLNVDGVVGASTRAALGLDARPASDEINESILNEREGLELGLGEPLADHIDVA